MNGVWKRIAKLRRNPDERGVTLVDAVMAVALFFAIGGAFVYAFSTLVLTEKNTVDQAQTTISESGITNSFRGDISNARGFKLNSNGSNLLVARSDGSCVSWTIKPTSSTAPGELLRTSAQNQAAALNGGSVLARDVGSGTITLGRSNAELSIIYDSGAKLTESVPLTISGSDGGVCW